MLFSQRIRVGCLVPVLLLVVASFLPVQSANGHNVRHRRLSTETLPEENMKPLEDDLEDNMFWSRMLQASSSISSQPPAPNPMPTPTPSPSVPPSTLTSSSFFPSSDAVLPSSPPSGPPSTLISSSFFPSSDAVLPSSSPSGPPSTFTSSSFFPSSDAVVPVTVVADFTDGTPETPLVLTSLGSDLVQVILGDPIEDTVYSVQGNGNNLGSTCPPPGGVEIPSTATVITIPLGGVDTTIVICRGGVIVGVCYHVFSTTSTTLDYQVSLDFSGASQSNPLFFYFPSGSGTGRVGNGGYFLGGGAPGGSGFLGRGGFFFTATGAVSVGDSCPPAGATILPPYPEFPFALFTLASQESAIIYACDGVVVGICELEYISNNISTNPSSSATDPPSPMPTSIVAETELPTFFIPPSPMPTFIVAETELPTFFIPPIETPTTSPSSSPSETPSTSLAPKEWVRVQRIQGAQNVLWGYDVAISDDGNTVISGAFQTANSAGTVAVYDVSDDNMPILTQSIAGEMAPQELGRSLSMSGDGSLYAVSVRPSQVRIYNIASGGEPNTQITLEVATSPRLWIALSKDGTTLAAGTFGYLRVFRSTNGFISYDQLPLVVDDLVNGAPSPTRPSLSEDGNTISFWMSGTQWVYRLASGGTSWDPILSIEGIAGLSSLSASGDRVALQNVLDEVSVYDMAGDGTFIRVGSPIVGPPGSRFGQDLSLTNDGTGLVISADTYSANWRNGGLVQVFRETVIGNDNTRDWRKTPSDILGNANGKQLGFAVGISSDGLTVVAGGPQDSSIPNSGRGDVAVYRYR